MIAKSFKWIATGVFAIAAAATIFIALFGWNWLRPPLEHYVTAKTGRTLSIKGDLKLKIAWPLPRIEASDVTFSNPSWAKEPQMLRTGLVEVRLDLMALLHGRVVFPEVSLVRPTIFFERGPDGRKSWLLDLDQKDEAVRIQIDHLRLDRGTLGYDDAALKTSIRASLATTAGQDPAASTYGLDFSAAGQFNGIPIKAQGSAGPVLVLRNDGTPYALKFDADLGRTRVKGEGHVTNLLKLTAVDMSLALRGDNLDQLFPLLGLPLPSTRAYITDGHLIHSGNVWRYEKFTGRFGDSDIAGTIKVETGGPRPVLTADLSSNLLDIEDLGPLIGARPGSVKAARQAAAVPPAPGATPARMRVLPDLPFKTDRWDSLDADVNLRAKSIRRARELPLENLQVHLLLRDAMVTLDPIDFGLAGGHLNAVITLDGRKRPIQAHARVKAQKLLLARLFPTAELNKASIGQINGVFDLKGTGDSVGRMLASANGKASLVVAGGKISKLMMEKAGIHLWEILELNLTGDRLIELRCALADFDVRQGVLRPGVLVLDTQVTTLVGTGSIDLGQEELNLTLNQKTKNTSPLALRSPIYVRGSFAKPVVSVDKGRAIARALGAVTLGLVNPFLALIPLIDPGPGKDSDCGQLLATAKSGAGNEKLPNK